MGLNKIVKVLLKFNDSLEKVDPNSKKYINFIFQSIRELIDHSIYCDSKGNNNRYPYYKKNSKRESIIIFCEKITEECNEKNINYEKVFNLLIELQTVLKWIRISINISLTNLNRLITRIEKKIENKS